MAETSFKFAFSENWYTVEGAKLLDERTLRQEYTRMRDVAQKRIKRLQKEFSESKAYQSNRDGFTKLKDLDPRDLPKAFSELAKFVRAKSSSVSGQREIRKKTIETWNAQGLKLNNRNYKKAIKILEEMRKQKLTYGSDKVVELADSMLELDERETNKWLDHLGTLLENTETVSDVVASHSDQGTPVNIDDVLREIGW